MNPYVALRSADFLAALQALLPSGDAWPRDNAATLTKFLAALADIQAALHSSVGMLSETESDPRATSALLAEWERAFGLPDSCAPADQSLQERRDALISRITDNGGTSRQNFIDLAAAMGIAITITEFRPFRAGAGKAGDPDCDAQWLFAWQVNAPLVTQTYFRAGQSAAGEALASWGNDRLECAIQLRNRASRTVQFAYN